MNELRVSAIAELTHVVVVVDHQALGRMEPRNEMAPIVQGLDRFPAVLHSYVGTGGQIATPNVCPFKEAIAIEFHLLPSFRGQVTALNAVGFRCDDGACSEQHEFLSMMHTHMWRLPFCRSTSIT